MPKCRIRISTVFRNALDSTVRVGLGLTLTTFKGMEVVLYNRSQ